MAIKITKIWMTDCKPCNDVQDYLEELQDTYEFEVDSLNITAEAFAERKKAKQTLAKYGTIKVPLLIISVDGEDKASVYKEHVGENTPEYKTKLEDILKTL